MSKYSLHFLDTGWDDYLYWQKTDRKMLPRLNRLLAETQRTPFGGTGKPEALKENYRGYWSRRIDDQHRLVYRVIGDEVQIIGCRFHYK